MQKHFIKDICYIIDKFLAGTKDLNGNDRSLEEINKERRLAGLTIENLIDKACLELLDLIAKDQGWEDTKDFYLDKFFVKKDR